MDTHDKLCAAPIEIFSKPGCGCDVFVLFVRLVGYLVRRKEILWLFGVN